MNDWKILARARMKELKISQYDLADKIGCSQPSIAHWLSGRRKADIDTINKILVALGFSPLSTDFDEAFVNLDQVHAYPFISWTSAGLNCEEWKPKTAEDFIKTNINAGKKGFWLKIKGDSMTSMKGFSFPEGVYILINPDIAIHDGDFVVAKFIRNNQITFRQYVEETGSEYLKPLNNTYKTIALDENWQIIGRVVEAKWKLIH
ncbi:LexA family protein [Entomomonas asaccharolytica]|uniref:Helix-turn-helix domain-containing protein n=1 Tax=Entomomonas asaccharolytica TaxID=2785331 RepID=A0A974NE44_9GAMM|nr:LexA family transcriptional regulator [Entomomonas asaccharolytica]QQP85095.1 helix-turn-helix domain-containing protein [Entomomonas asaccharolytica]